MPQRSPHTVSPRATDYFARDDAAVQWWTIDRQTGGVYAEQLEFLRRHVPLREARALDIATGPGRFAIEMAVGGATDVVAADISAAMIDVAAGNARRQGVGDRISFQVADAARLDLPRESFDVVSIMEVLVHLPDPARVLAHAAELLRPGGWLLTNHHTASAPRILYGIDRGRALRAKLFRRSRPEVVIHETVEEAVAALDGGAADNVIITRPRDAYRGISATEVDRWLSDAGLTISNRMMEYRRLALLPFPIGRTILARKPE